MNLMEISLHVCMFFSFSCGWTVQVGIHMELIWYVHTPISYLKINRFVYFLVYSKASFYKKYSWSCNSLSEMVFFLNNRNAWYCVSKTVADICPPFGFFPLDIKPDFKSKQKVPTNITEYVSIENYFREQSHSPHYRLRKLKPRGEGMVHKIPYNSTHVVCKGN